MDCPPFSLVSTRTTLRSAPLPVPQQRQRPVRGAVVHRDDLEPPDAGSLGVDRGDEGGEVRRDVVDRGDDGEGDGLGHHRRCGKGEVGGAPGRYGGSGMRPSARPSPLPLAV